MVETVLWRRLDIPGHDAARLAATGESWRLTGAAVFLDDGGPAWLSYSVVLDGSWATIRGRVRGFLGTAEVDRAIERRAEGWHLDGRLQRGLGHLVDLDLGFTPATNLQQLRRVGLRVGESAEVPVAWFDAGESGLVELPQVYHRLDASRYAYESPTAGYRGILEIAANGFVRSYPELWLTEACGSNGSG